MTILTPLNPLLYVIERRKPPCGGGEYENKGVGMARVNMAEIVEALDSNFERVLKSVIDEASPGNQVDGQQLMRLFRKRLERGFANWEQVPDRAVDAE